MDNKEYVKNKAVVAYDLLCQGKYSRKARTIVLKDNRLLVIKINYNNGDIHYLLPGGTVDEGENTKNTAVRETLEEYGVIVNPIKYLGKQYYKMNMELDGKKFQSRVIDFYYICEYISTVDGGEFGIDGEFTKNDRKYQKTTLSLDELKEISPSTLNDMDQTNYDRLISYMETQNKNWQESCQFFIIPSL